MFVSFCVVVFSVVSAIRINRNRRLSGAIGSEGFYSARVAVVANEHLKELNGSIITLPPLCLLCEWMIPI